MNHRDVAAEIAEALAGEPGWERHQPHHFRHLDAGIHLLVYGMSISVVFGRDDEQLYDKALSASTAHFPRTTIAAALEVARALVTVREQIAADLGLTPQQRAEWRELRAKAARVDRPRGVPVWTLTCPSDDSQQRIAGQFPLLPPRCRQGHLMTWDGSPPVSVLDS